MNVKEIEKRIDDLWAKFSDFQQLVYDTPSDVSRQAIYRELRDTMEEIDRYLTYYRIAADLEIAQVKNTKQLKTTAVHDHDPKFAWACDKCWRDGIPLEAQPMESKEFSIAQDTILKELDRKAFRGTSYIPEPHLPGCLLSCKDKHDQKRS